MTHNTQDIHSLIDEEFKTAMLVSQTPQGELRSRPMVIAKQQKDGTITFVTSEESAKADELLKNPEVNVSMQSTSVYVSLSGESSFSKDKSRIEKLWSPAWKAWFPEGKESDDILLVDIKPSKGEFWDMSGTKGLEFLYKAGKAIFQGEKVSESTETNHQKVTFN